MLNKPTAKKANEFAPRLLAASLPNSMVLRVAAGSQCPCGARVRPYPKPNNGGFELLCDDHHSFIVFECAS